MNSQYSSVKSKFMTPDELHEHGLLIAKNLLLVTVKGSLL